ncbi:MAG: alpha/beta hydrolase [Syntrophorhabdaceae bacterium]|nr:alpha/beta hydrolase [Syntrophorhabdaceae bacterium]
MDIFVEREGKGEKVVFIHGAGGNGRSWFFQKEYLKDAFETVVIDLPGHGMDGDGAGMDSIDGYRDYLYRLVKTLGIEGCFLVGHSMGGAIAMSFALQYPEILKGLILITTGAKLRVFPEILEGLKKDKEKAVRMIMDYAFWHKSPERLKENGVKEMMKCRAEVILGDFLACEGFDVMDRVYGIRVPTLIIAGKYDLLTPPKFSEYLHSQIKGSRLEIVEDAGHMVTLERPEVINPLIKGWIQEIIRK